MSAMKLQKLVFYSQAQTLASRGEPLFSEAIEAWNQGPVVPALFELHRGKFMLSAPWPAGDAGRVTERSIVDQVIDQYGSFTGEQLSQLTHREAPWLEARRGKPPGVRMRSAITPELIRRYFHAA